MTLSDMAKESLAKVVERFQAGDLSPIVQAALIPLPENAPALKWTPRNRMLAYAQGNCIDCRGYKQWQKAGRQVRKKRDDEKTLAVWISAPRTYKKTKEDGEEEARVWFTYIPVYPIHNTEAIEGLPFDEVLTYEPKQPPPLMEVAERLGMKVTWAPCAGEKLGSVDQIGTHVKLETHDPKTWFHELVHAVDARLNGDLKGGQHADQETRAELGACVLMQMYGLGDRLGNCWRYIEGYNEDPLRAITAATEDVAAILDVILENGKEEKHEQERGM